ncbi:hypothetical protein FEM48_Zijuj10G0031200 [Ziziphus jujuba var. spinosa]|uniref:Bifunctional inhibitor/plant lipid transfer protein/seed storage helical domain-containing protein n=1 Tax=Ziziphus jujuba var. spinosa TaxID=714518 RepID=A0A978UKY1_ZIZJJ|nr:hypothetical protein FEM48_Zijuj10G0031200 [Ziziphus jujuba var. spinosa]
MMKAVLLLLSVVGCGMVGITMGAGIEEKCGADFQKVAVCLNYATGKAATPTKDCCDSVKGIKDKDPECLCYIMEQTHKGNEQIKNMGIQEAKLLQLPSACSLTNASLSDCPKLLGLSPSSPDAAIFTNASTPTPAASSTTTTPASTSSSEKADNSSVGTNLGPHVVVLLAMAMAIVFISFPSSGSALFASN